jgi:hypothetical protein
MNYPNVNKYDEKGYAPPLKPGSYVVKVDDIKTQTDDGGVLKDSKGCEYVRFVFTVNDKPNKVFESFYFDPEGPYAEMRLGKFKQFLIAVGENVEGGEIHNLLGKVCRVTLKIRDYKDKKTGDARQANDILAFEPPNNDDSFGGPEDDDLPY